MRAAIGVQTQPSTHGASSSSPTAPSFCSASLSSTQVPVVSWVRSTAVAWLDETAGRARTASGRRYALGRRTTVANLPTEEARIAFAFLVSPHLADPGAEPPVDGDSAAAAAWVAACKVARHLGLEAPPLRDPAAVTEFLASVLRPPAIGPEAILMSRNPGGLHRLWADPEGTQARPRKRLGATPGFRCGPGTR